MSRVMALRHDLVSCPEEFPGIRQGNDKASPCRRSSVAWLQERRFHLNFRRFQSVAGADGKASLHTCKVNQQFTGGERKVIKLNILNTVSYYAG